MNNFLKKYLLFCICIGYVGARSPITRIAVGKKANYEENQTKPWKIREIVITLQS